MKRVKGARRKFHKLAMKVVLDYYFNSTNLNVLKALEGEKVELNDEEKSDLWAIRQNIEDLTYRQSLGFI